MGAVLFILILVSWVYWMFSWLAVRRIKPPVPLGDYFPPVSILKPVKGLDEEAYGNFLSHCSTASPASEILFGVAEPSDSAVPVIRKLQEQNPCVRIKLVIENPGGPNRKAGMLHILAGQAAGDLIVLTDSDIRVDPDFLRRIVAPLADPRVGLVTCPYIGCRARSIPARLELLHMGATFLPSALIAHYLFGMQFGMGAASALRRRDLERLGGFAVLREYLADDFQLGKRIAALGLRVAIGDTVVRSAIGKTTLREQLDRELRWSHCCRHSRPLEYPGLFLTFSTPLAVTLCLLEPAAGSFALLGGSLAVRWLTGWITARRLRDRDLAESLFLLPVRDVLSCLVWVIGFVGVHVRWRGVRYRVLRGGRLASADRG